MPASARRWVLTTLASLVWLTLLPAPSVSTLPEPDAPWFPATGAYLGASVSAQADETLPVCRDTSQRTSREAFEHPVCTGKGTFLDHQFHRWDGSRQAKPWPTDYDRWSRDQGRRLFINWTARRADGEIVRWAEIAGGRHDATIDAQAQAVKAFEAPIYLSFHAEPEHKDASSPWGTPKDFRTAWRRIVDRFRAADVDNVRWVFTLMAWTWNPSSKRDPSAFWPGTEYVDAVGVDGYNWYGCSGAKNAWASLGAIMQRPYEWAEARGKPMFVAEWGSVEDPADHERKGLWLREAAEWVKSHPNVKALTYFHRDDVEPSVVRDCDWTVDTSLASLLAFRSLVVDPYFNPVPALPIG